MVKINGEAVDAAGMTIAEYLKTSGFDTQRIAVECNETFVPKTEYGQTVLKEGDIVEVVSFVGGG